MPTTAMARLPSSYERLAGFTMTLSAFTFLSPPKGPNEIGWLGGYRVLRKVEEGGMAFVFEAEDVTLGRRVALKVLKPAINSDSLRKRFFQEARLAAGLHHDNIVTIYQFGN